jgi:hypothetical protein
MRYGLRVMYPNGTVSTYPTKYDEVQHARFWLEYYRTSYKDTGRKYTLIRFVSHREKLRRQLTERSDYYTREAKYDGLSERGVGWYEGYARALRDVAGQL